MGFAAEGGLRIANRDETRRALALLREAGSDITTEIVDDRGDAGTFASLVIAPDDTLAIAY